MDNKKRYYDIFISHPLKNTDLAQKINKIFEQEGISAWMASNDIEPGVNCADSIMEAISSCKYFMPIITEEYLSSKYCLNELQLAFDESAKRQKHILPICTSYDLLSKGVICYYINRNNVFMINKDDDEVIADEIRKISRIIIKEKNKTNLFDKLSEYIKSGANEKATSTLCDIIVDECEEAKKMLVSNSVSQPLLGKLLQILKHSEKVLDLYDYEYGEAAKKLAKKKNKMINVLSSLLSYSLFGQDVLIMHAIAIQLIYFEREIRWTCADALTNGDVSEHIVDAYPVVDYAEKQETYVKLYRKKIEKLWTEEPGKYHSQKDFWDKTSECMFENRLKKDLRLKRKQNNKPEKSSEDELLAKVANFMKEGNAVLECIAETEAAAEFLRCLITSYERLRAYCETIGENNVCAECIDRIFEIKKKLENATVEKASDKVGNGIKSLLGITIPKTGKFDVFLSHKKEDYDIAKDMNDYLHRELKEVFFDAESLVQMSESEYRKSIMRALEGSTHFVLMCSNLDYLNSKWVALEMEIFQSEIDEGRKKNSNFIIVVTEDVYQQIIDSNKEVIPIDYRRCEIIKINEYQNKILGYLR